MSGLLKITINYWRHKKIYRRGLSHCSKMKILNVAEKNDAAKNIAGLLSKGTSIRREGLSPYNKIYEFDFQIFNQSCRMVMSSVSGHLLAYEFPSMFRSWTSCDPVALFDAPVCKHCPENYEKIKKTLEREVRTCSKLIIWTDCDREGENIGFEIIQVCKDIKTNLEVFRAQFSEITGQSVFRAVRGLKDPDKRASDAVDVRMELDLRIGAAFTRFQTLHLKHKFPNALMNNLISYGSCQFPTLGFVVERYNAIRNFVSEPFWKIKVSDTKNELTVEFIWKRGRLFNELACKALFDTCLETPLARVESVVSKPKIKWRPKPLDTVEMEKLVSRKLRINAKETMKIAEKLYTQGYISYPRTETNIFPREMNLTSLVEQQVNDTAWGEFAQRVLNDGANPNQGSKSDQAHPPIHPTKPAPQLAGQEKRLYEFIVRHFLACVSKNAEGLETIVDIDIANEKFTAKGLMIIARNYLDVYPYDKWNAKEIHVYHVGDTFEPHIEITDGETSAPDLLTEADLIALMDKHGIGTDATHADHIETIKTRAYVGMQDERYFLPKTLGMGLVEGYDNMGFEMSKPRLRAQLENDLKLVCTGQKRPDDVLRDQILKYKEIFVVAQRQVSQLEAALQAHLGEQPAATSANIAPAAQPPRVAPCPTCSSYLVLKTRREDNKPYAISCASYPSCRAVFWLQSLVETISVSDDFCQVCGPTSQMINIKFIPGSTFLPTKYKGCISGCDSILLDVLRQNVQSYHGSEHHQRQIDQSQQRRPAQSQQSQPAQNQQHQNVTLNYNATNRHSDPVEVRCQCGRPAVKLTVRKPGPNQGKAFYKCDVPPNSTGCNFFQWSDLVPDRGPGPGSGPGPGPGPGPGHGPGGLGRGPSFHTRRDPLANSPTSNANENSNCYCGALTARLTVKKSGPNQGRSFFCCNKSMDDRSKCDFFQWCDDNVTAGQVPPSRPTTSRRGRGGGSTGTSRKPYLDKGAQPSRKRKCGICGEEGHTKKTCPAK